MNFRSVLLVAINVYGLPLFFLMVIYVRIIRFIRHQSTNLITAAIKRRQDRNLIVFKRIFVLVSILIILGIPSIIIIIIQTIQNSEYLLLYRIAWFSAKASMVILSIGTVLMTPQLKSIVIKNYQPNQVIPIHVTTANSIRVRTIPIIQ